MKKQSRLLRSFAILLLTALLSCTGVIHAQILPSDDLVPLVTNPPAVGTFFLIQNRLGPPYPFDPSYGMLPVYQWKPGVFLVDDSQVDYSAAAVHAANAAMSLMAGPTPCDPCSTNGSGGGAGYVPPVPSYSSGDLWLEMRDPTNQTATLLVHRPSSNQDVYDLIYTTNLNPVAT